MLNGRKYFHSTPFPDKINEQIFLKIPKTPVFGYFWRFLVIFARSRFFKKNWPLSRVSPYRSVFAIVLLTRVFYRSLTQICLSYGQCGTVKVWSYINIIKLHTIPHYNIYTIHYTMYLTGRKKFGKKWIFFLPVANLFWRLLFLPAIIFIDDWFCRRIFLPTLQTRTFSIF